MPMTLDEMMTAIGKAEKAGDTAAASWMRQQAQEQLTGKAGLWANLGAGANRFVEGSQQLVGMGPSDEQLKETRRIDEMAARSTPGGGVAQFAGEVLPTLAMPGGLGARALTRTLGAVRGAPAAAQGARLSVPMATGGSALEAGAAGAFMPTLSDESRLANIGISAGFGAGAPVLAKTLGGLGRGAYQVGQRALAAAPGQIGERAATRLGERAATEGLERSNVPLDPARYRAQDYQPNTMPTGVRGQPLAEFDPSTAAAYHGTPELAAVEKATRQYDAPSWATRDAAEQAKRWERLDANLRGEPDVTAALNRADQLSPPYQVSPKKFDSAMAGFVRDLENMTAMPAYIGNPSVRQAVDMLRKQIDSGTIVPETLHELRKTLAKGLSGPPGTSEAAVRAARSDPAIHKLMDKIDNVMEASAYSGQQRRWSDWKRDYSGELATAEASKAENQLRRTFVDEHGRPLSGGGTVPDITPTRLTRAADDLSRVQSGPRVGQQQFTKQAEQAVSDILRDLDAAGIVQRVTKAATLGGSATAHNLAVMGATTVLGDLMFDHLAGSGGGLIAGGLIASRSKANVEAAKRAILTRIMQDPAQFRQFVAQSAQRAQQLAQQQGLAAGRYGAAGATGAQLALEPEQQR